MGLVTAGQLRTYLRCEVDEPGAELAIRVASGWLASAVPGHWPDPVPEDLWAWALELASIAYTNPEGLSTRTVDSVTDAWTTTRRAEILAAAARRYGAAGGPLFAFPAPQPWPGLTW